MPDTDHIAPQVYGDAQIITPYNETDYADEIVITVGGRRDSKQWKPVPMPAGAFIAQLCRHKEGQKDGAAFVLGDMVPGQRLKTSVKTLYGVGLDIDTGTPTVTVDAALKKLGCVAVRYSTHSSGKQKTEIKKDKVIKFSGTREIDGDLMRDFLLTVEQWDRSIVDHAEYLGTDHTEKGIVCQISHPPMPKHRIVVLFKEPFVIENEASTQQDAMKKWAKVPEALAHMLGVPFDTSCTDPSRLFYTPRHAKGKPFGISLFGGPYFDWRTLELENPLDKLSATLTKGKSKSVTEEGRALGRWSLKRAHGFQIADVLEAHAPDRIRHNTGHGLEIECPFDEDHSNAGDTEDRACLVVNAGEGQSEFFTISCRHETCRDKTNLDMLGKMVKDGWFPLEATDDEQFNAIADEADAQENYDAAIEALAKDAKPDEIRAVIALLAGLDEIEQDQALVRIKARTTGLGIVRLRELLKKAIHESRDREAESATNSSESQQLAKALSKSLGSEFKFPPKHLGKSHLGTLDGKIWLYSSGCDPERVSTPFMLADGVNFADEKGRRAMRVHVLNNASSKWTAVEIETTDLSMKGTAALDKLMSAGLAPTMAGKDFIIAYLTESNPPEVLVYNRPGFRGDLFVCPTGEVLLSTKPVELAHEKKLKCRSQAGSFEAWRDSIEEIFALPIERAYHFQAGVLMGWAGSLCNLADDVPLGYFFDGPSSTGKTSAEGCGAASWCDPDPKTGEGLFRSAKGTDNSHEAFFEKCSGTFGALDEFGKLDAKAQQDIFFMLEGGTGKRRLDSKAQERKTRSWRGFAFAASSETELAANLRLGGIKMAGGLAARMMTITSPPEDMNLEPAQFAHVENALANFGWGGPAFVRALHNAGHVGAREGLKAKLAEKIIETLEGATSPYQRRAARHVAYLWAAGWIAQDEGLIPQKYDLEALATKLWDDVRGSSSGPTDPNERALATLVDAITARKDADIVELSVLDQADKKRFRKEAVGFYDAAERHYIIRETKFDELSGGIVSGRSFRKYLDKSGYLIRPKVKTTSKTWSGYPGLSRDGQYVVLCMDKIDN